MVFESVGGRLVVFEGADGITLLMQDDTACQSVILTFDGEEIKELIKHLKGKYAQK